MHAPSPKRRRSCLPGPHVGGRVKVTLWPGLGAACTGLAWLGAARTGLWPGAATAWRGLAVRPKAWLASRKGAVPPPKPKAWLASRKGPPLDWPAPPKPEDRTVYMAELGAKGPGAMASLVVDG